MGEGMSDDGDNQPLVGTVQLDLGELGLGSGPWPCTVLLDVLGSPDRLDIRFPMNMDVAWNGGLMKDREVVRGRMATVTLADGSSLEAEVQLFDTWHGDMVKDGQLNKEMSGTFHLGQSVWRKYPSASADLWRFGLTNVKLRHADYPTEYGEGESRRVIQNAVRFHIGGRDWTLVDDFAEKWRGLDESEKAHALLTARLETAYREGDMRQDLEVLATDIEALLRLALSRAVTWVSCAHIADGQVMEEYYRGAWVAPFRISSQPINDGFMPGQLRSFIETTYPQYVANRDWFCKSIILYLVSQLGAHLEVRLSLQNTLLDRMADKVLAEDAAAEIDPELPGRLDKPFKRRLHKLLSELSPNWTRERTGRLIGTIKGWNESPSFPGGVERAAMRLGLFPPEKSQLGKRHKLIHLGEYDDADGSSIYDDYWQPIECFVVMMLLRMLGYAGPFYHIALGPNQKVLGDLMADGTEMPPYPVQEPAVSGGRGAGPKEEEE